MNKLVEQLGSDEGINSDVLRDKLDSGRAIIFKAPPSGRAVAVGDGL